jgi:hypothetical protein
MKTTLRVVVLGAACWLAAASTQAQNYVDGDLLLGFTGNSSDFIYDLGQFSGLSYGQTWNVGAGLGNRFGVVGASSSGKHIYATSGDGAENGFDPSFLYNTALANIRTISGQPAALIVGGSRLTSPSDTTGWTYQTAQSAGTPGNTFQNNFFNPNVDASLGAFLFDNANSGIVVATGLFKYDSGSGVLSYNVVPEPAAGALVATGLILLVALRHPFRRAR